MRPPRIIALAGLAGALALVGLARAPEHGTAIAGRHVRFVGSRFAMLPGESARRVGLRGGVNR